MGTDVDVELARLAGGVAHDLRTILLTPLAVLVEETERALGAGQPTRASALLRELREMIRHGDAALERLLVFARQRTTPPQRLRLEPDGIALRAVHIARLHLQRRSGAAATSIELLPLARHAIEADAEELIVALVEVIVNAIDAVQPEGGRVVVRTGSTAHEVCFEITDTGPGFAPAIRARALEPFVAGGGATGLGLAIAAACAQRHGGRLELADGDGGSRVALVFPAA